MTKKTALSEDTSEWKTSHREALQESIQFLGRNGKFKRECWVVKRLLRAFGIKFLESQLTPAEEPSDVQFLDAQFQVKELLQSDRRRGDELRQKLTSLEKANSLADLIEPYTPRDIPYVDVVDTVLVKAAQLEAASYGPSEIRNLDLLCYFNFLDVSVVAPFEAGPFQSTFRSVSVVSNTYCGVIHARTTRRTFCDQIWERFVYQIFKHSEVILGA